MSCVVGTSEQTLPLIKLKQIDTHYVSSTLCMDYIWWINYQTVTTVKCSWVTPCWLWGDTRQRPNLGGNGDKLLLCCSSPGPVFIIQCENLLDESQGCFCMLCLVGMPVFSTSKVKRLISASKEKPCLESPGSFFLMKSQKVLMIFPLQGCLCFVY